MNSNIENCNAPNIAGIEKGVTHGYTAPSDGIIILEVDITDNCDCDFLINNVAVARIRWYGGKVNDTNVFPITIPIAKGHSLTVDGLTSGIAIDISKFIPYKS